MSDFSSGAFRLVALMLCSSCALLSCSAVGAEEGRETTMQDLPRSGWTAKEVVRLPVVSKPREHIYETTLICRFDTRIETREVRLEARWLRGSYLVGCDTLSLDIARAFRPKEQEPPLEGISVTQGVYTTEIDQRIAKATDLTPAGLYTLELRLLYPLRVQGVTSLGVSVLPAKK